MYRWYLALFFSVALFAYGADTRSSGSSTLQVESAPATSTVAPADCCGYPPPDGGGDS